MNCIKKTLCIFSLAVGLWSTEQSLFAAPANDNLANAATITGLPGSATGSNLAATMQIGEPDHADKGVAGASVWWTWTAPTSSFVTIKTAGSAFDTLLGVYTGAAFPLTTVASNDDDSNASTNTSRVDFSAVAGTTYQIAVAGFNSATGSINLSVAIEPPANDNLENAPEVYGLNPLPVEAFSYNATSQPGENTHAGEGPAKSVWWKWMAPKTSSFHVSTAGSNYDTVLAVYSGTSFPLTPVAENDDGLQVDGSSELDFNGTNGTTYYIAIDGKGGRVERLG